MAFKSEYLAKVYENIEKRNPGEKEFLQAVKEVFVSLEPVVEQNPNIEKWGIMERIVEPERFIQFRVAWVDDSAFVGANCGVELNTVAAVDLNLAVVIHPGHTEANHTVRLHKGLDDTVFLILGMLIDDGVDAFQNLQDSLVEFFLVRIAGNHLSIDALQIFALQHIDCAFFFESLMW